MSVQLIVYPQWYDGIPNGINYTGTTTSEMLSDNTNWTTANVGAGILSSPSNAAQEAVNSFYPNLSVGSWKGYFNLNGGGANGGVVGTNGSLILQFYSAGVFQMLGGLNVGASYDITITWDVSAAYPVKVRMFTATTLNSTTIASPNALGVWTGSFIATTQNKDIFCIDYFNEGNNTTILEASITGSSQGVPSAIQNLENGAVICDLYDDEDLPLTLSVDNFKNAAEKIQSYSKAFNLPATKRNNLIFDNVFEITRYVDANSINFNPLMRTKVSLKQDGFILFEGFLRLIDISDKDGETSYNVNLYAEVTALADTLKSKTFQDMPFTELDHDYSKTNIFASGGLAGITYLQPSTSGFRNTQDTIKYPFVDWNHQMVVGNGSPAAVGIPQLTNLEQAYRPWIQLKYLVDRIFSDSGFTYTSEFFDLELFTNLYMDFNWGADDNGAAPNRNDSIETDGNTADYFIDSQSWKKIKVLYTSGNNDLWDNTNYKFTSDVNNLECTGSFRLQLENIAVINDWTARSRICKFNQYGVVLEVIKTEDKLVQSGGSFGMTGNFSTTLQLGEYIQMQSLVLSQSAFDKIKMSDNTLSFLNITYQNEASSVVTLLDSARADINQWEFLKGIMTMFNLVTLPDPENPNNLIIETYNQVFLTTSEGTTLADRNINLDWTEKIDTSTMKLEPLEDLNKYTIFKYAEDDDDYPFNQYKRNVQGFLYGSFEYDASGLTLLEGIDEVVAEPFAATVIKPLMSQFAELIVPSIYAMNDDGESEGFDNAPRIMYNNGFSSAGTDFYIPAQNGESSVVLDSYLQFSHFTFTAPTTLTHDYNFGACQLIPNYSPIVNNLFNTYWLPYYAELYDPNTRIMTIKVNLSAGDINTFKFNDRVMIKNRIFRVNTINYKPNDLSIVEFILINGY